MRKIQQLRQRVLDEMGVTLVEMHQGRAHVTYRIRTPRGPRTVVASNTPRNEGIAIKAFRRDVRKVLTPNRQ